MTCWTAFWNAWSSGEMSFEEIVAKGYDPATVKRVEQLLYVAEYKRRQAPPGVKISRAISAATGAIPSPMPSATRGESDGGTAKLLRPARYRRRA